MKVLKYWPIIFMFVCILVVALCPRTYSAEVWGWSIANEVEMMTSSYSMEVGRRENVVLDRVSTEVKTRFQYLDDPPDIERNLYRTFEEMELNPQGDCEDFVVWTLVNLIKQGYPKEKLGFQVYLESGNKKAGHVDTIVKHSRGVFVLDQNGDYIPASKELESLSLDSIIVVNLGTGVKHWQQGPKISSIVYDEFFGP